MTKKDYIILATVLARGYKSGVFKNMKHFSRFIYFLDEYLKEDNPLFDLRRFEQKITEVLESN